MNPAAKLDYLISATFRPTSAASVAHPRAPGKLNGNFKNQKENDDDDKTPWTAKGTCSECPFISNHRHTVGHRLGLNPVDEPVKALRETNLRAGLRRDG
jgi:hypothetical protein